MLAITVEDGWRPGIGDPTVGGWLTVAAYFVAAALCWRTSRLSASRTGGWLSRSAAPWTVLCLFLIVLGVNKQLDLQTWLTVAGKRMAIAQGWYEDRRAVQVLFIGVIGMAAVGGLAALIWVWRRQLRQLGLALGGAAFLLAFVVIRASSFHHVDQLLGVELGGLRVNWILEIGGVVCVAAGAWRQSKRLKESCQAK